MAYGAQTCTSIITSPLKREPHKSIIERMLPLYARKLLTVIRFDHIREKLGHSHCFLRDISLVQRTASKYFL